MDRIHHWWQRQPASERISFVAVLVVAPALAVLLIVSPSSEPSSTYPAHRQKPRRESTSTRPGGTLPACGNVNITKDADGRLTCRTRNTTVVLARGTTPVLLPDISVRVLRAAVEDGGLQVNLRIRNLSSTSKTANQDARQLYLSLGGRRIRVQPPTGISLSAGEGRTVTLRFPLDSAATRSLAAANSRAELRVVPFAELSANHVSRIGVIRLQLAKR